MRKSAFVVVIIVDAVAIVVGVLLRFAFSSNVHESSQLTPTSQNGNTPQVISSNENQTTADQNTNFQVSARDYKDTSITYSTLMLSVPQDAFASRTEIKISAVPPMPCGNLSGAYLLSPQGQKLLAPATVSITYTNAAVALHKECYSDFTEANLTLAYYDNGLNKYVALQSTFDPSTRMVSGSISQFYSGGIMVVPTSLIH